MRPFKIPPALMSLPEPTPKMGPVLKSESECAGGSKFNAARAVSIAKNLNGVPPRRITLTDATAETRHDDCGRDAVAPDSVVCDRAQRRARGSTRYLCAGRKESTAQCAAAQVALPGLAAVAGHERDDALAIGLRGGYMV